METSVKEALAPAAVLSDERGGQQAALVSPPTTAPDLEAGYDPFILQDALPHFLTWQPLKRGDYTEHTSLQYLARHAPQIPMPKPLGLVVSNTASYIFMSFVLGIKVDRIWSKLSEQHRVFLKDRLNKALLELRQLRLPDSSPLGGLCGEGYKDTVRGL